MTTKWRNKRENLFVYRKHLFQKNRKCASIAVILKQTDFHLLKHTLNNINIKQQTSVTTTPRMCSMASVWMKEKKWNRQTWKFDIFESGKTENEKRKVIRQQANERESSSSSSSSERLKCVWKYIVKSREWIHRERQRPANGVLHFSILFGLCLIVTISPIHFVIFIYACYNEIEKETKATLPKPIIIKLWTVS